MEKEFLHKINVKALLKEIGMTLDELADVAGYSRASNLNKWGDEKAKGGARPSYNTFVKLIEAGATVETLFGVNYKAGETIVEKTASQDQIMDAVRKALADLGKTR